MGDRIKNVDLEPWADFKAVGLYRDGIHHDSRVIAKKADGGTVEIDVSPVHVSEGGTLFVPNISEARIFREIMPPLKKRVS